ncbi:MAG: hypothetical protein PHO09_05020 [Sphaerochaeta sp.]|nr:hypothetical protein [Sphaerochaeta sp.]
MHNKSPYDDRTLIAPDVKRGDGVLQERMRRGPIDVVALRDSDVFLIGDRDSYHSPARSIQTLMFWHSLS